MWNSFGKGVAAALGDQTIEDRLKALPAEIEKLRNIQSAVGKGTLPGIDDQIARDLKEQKDLSSKSASSQMNIKSQADYFREQQRSLEVGGLVRGLLPDDMRHEDLMNRRTSLEKFYSPTNPINGLGLLTDSGWGAAGLVGATQAQQKEAQQRITDSLNPVGFGVAKVATESTSATAAITALTGSQRSAIEAQRVYADGLLQSKGAMVAAAEALASWNHAIAESNHQADEARMRATHEASLTRLSPLERRLSEINYESATNIRQATLTAPPVFRAAEIGAAAPPGGLAGNNPGNLIVTPWTERQPGYAGANGRFGTFDSAASGYRAAEANLQGYLSKGLTTPLQILSKWAPIGDGRNDPVAYADSIRKSTGFDPNAPLPSGVQAHAQMLHAMSLVEQGGRSASVSDIAGYISGGARAAAQLVPAMVSPAAAVVPLTSTAAANFGSANLTRQSTAIEDSAFGPIDKANEALRQQDRLEQARISTLGKSAGEIARATQTTALWNQVLGETYGKTDRLKGIMGQLGSEIDASAKLSADFATRQEKQNRITGAEGGIRDATQSSFSTVLSGLRNGESGSAIFQSVTKSLEDKAFRPSQQRPYEQPVRERRLWWSFWSWAYQLAWWRQRPRWPAKWSWLRLCRWRLRFRAGQFPFRQHPSPIVGRRIRRERRGDIAAPPNAPRDQQRASFRRWRDGGRRRRGDLAGNGRAAIGGRPRRRIFGVWIKRQFEHRQ